VSELSYKEAVELSYFGAKVIHPSTMRPVVEKSIPIFIRNTFEPEHQGTCISAGDEPEGAVRRRSLRRCASDLVRSNKIIFKGLTSVDSLALFNLEGMGMMGTLGIATRLFAALHREQVNVIFIAQASSEHSICFAIPSSQASTAKASVDQEFFKELHYKHIQPVTYQAPVSVIAMVGDGLIDTVGVAGLLFSALGTARVNVLAVSQGSSQRNISFVVHESDSALALQTVHDKIMHKIETEAEEGGTEPASPPRPPTEG